MPACRSTSVQSAPKAASGRTPVPTQNRQRCERAKLARERVDLLPRFERRELHSCVHRVGDIGGDVAIDPSPAHRSREDLAQRPVCTVAHRHWQARPPARNKQGIQLTDRRRRRRRSTCRGAAQPICAQAGTACASVHRTTKHLARRSSSLTIGPTRLSGCCARAPARHHSRNPCGSALFGPPRRPGPAPPPP